MKSIQLRTRIPGPKSLELARRRESALPRGLSDLTSVYVVRAEECWVEDVDGNRFLDFAGGIGCLNAGHRNPTVVAAIRLQLDCFLHTAVQVAPFEAYIRLAERLNQITPGSFPKRTFVVNMGAEAVENAVKIARAHTGRPGLIAFEDAFHGRTMMAMALTSKTQSYKAGFGPFPYRCSLFAQLSFLRSFLRPAFRRHVQADGGGRRCCRRGRRAGSQGKAASSLRRLSFSAS